MERTEKVNDRTATDEMLTLETALIHEAATENHDKVCSRGRDCRNREWHIRNDYVWREREKRVDYLTQLLAAAKAVR